MFIGSSGSGVDIYSCYLYDSARNVSYRTGDVNDHRKIGRYYSFNCRYNRFKDTNDTKGGVGTFCSSIMLGNSSEVNKNIYNVNSKLKKRV